MDLFKKLVLLSSLLALASCNETISPELQQGGVITPPDGETTPDTEHYFRVVNTSDESLEYLLHKTGAGNKAAKCEIVSETVPFSKNTYKPHHDITCFLEARELALYGSGFSLTVEASANACDSVKYNPFGYYNRIPGDSSGSYSFAKCENYSGPTPPQGCNTAISTTLTSPVAFPIPLEDGELCRFNYNDQEMCDVGTITISETLYTTVDDGSGGTTDIISTLPDRVIDCGGKPRKCVQGPYAKDSNNGEDFSPNGGLISKTVLDDPFSLEYSYPSLLEEKRASTHVYANYRRNLANYTIGYGEDDDSIPYKLSFTGIKDFHPQLITEYAFDGMNFLSYHGVTIPNGQANRYSAKPLAADPFMGLYNSTLPFRYDYTVQPFYNFECLDNSYETKARIRIMIRDWDRVISKDEGIADDVELISDIFRIPQGSVTDQDLSGNYYPW